MIKMTINEVRAIREKASLETIGMTTEELRQYFAQGANDIERRIADIRKKRGIALESINNSDTSKLLQKKEDGFIRGAEYYAGLTTAKADENAGYNIAVYESLEDYDSND